MRSDLIDAQSALDWAVSHIPVLEERIVSYISRRPYSIVAEPDPKGTGEVLLVSYSLGLFDTIINAEVGAIINAMRSALDLLAAALSRRNGVKPSQDTHFPIRKFARDFEREMRRVQEGIKRKKWLSKAEVAAIKSLKPYLRGNRHLYALHQLDILRKHERLIEVRPRPGQITLPMHLPGMRPIWRHHKNKTVILSLPAGTAFIPTKITLQVAFHETRLGLIHVPVIGVLREFARRVDAALRLFDN